MSFVGLYVISKFPLDGLTNSYAASIIFTTILTSFCHTTMFVSLAAYFVKISDPKYGGTYLTLLNTLSNFAGMWPKLPVMSAVDWLSKKNCISNLNGASDCKLEFDGFYLVASFCLILGFLIFQFWIKPEIKKLEIIPKHHWTIHSTSLIDVNEKINT
jgi:MFS transporter, PAT family, solute carrier family 33 (acetyl-CoA transportor), member 1